MIKRIYRDNLSAGQQRSCWLCPSESGSYIGYISVDMDYSIGKKLRESIIREMRLEMAITAWRIGARTDREKQEPLAILLCLYLMLLGIEIDIIQATPEARAISKIYIPSTTTTVGVHHLGSIQVGVFMSIYFFSCRVVVLFFPQALKDQNVSILWKTSGYYLQPANSFPS